MRPFTRYVLWQVPGWLAGLVLLWIGVALGAPLWLGGGLLAAWVAKDLLLFPAMRVAFSDAGPIHPIGAHAEAVERLAPWGYVRVHGELWLARTDGPVVEAGQRVIVRAGSGLTLSVEAPPPPARRGHDP